MVQHTRRPARSASQGLRGHVVLVDFWTYTCINCIRTLPYLKAWDQAYRSKGLTIVGVETPEFPFEREAGNVRDAISQFGLHYPVVQDNRMGTWNAYGNEDWPADYLIDAHGQVRYVSIGEGDYGETETAIRALLAENGATPGARGRPQDVVVPSQEATPETYLGTDRAEGWLAPPHNGLHDYGGPVTGQLALNEFAYSGSWRISGQPAIAVSNAGIDLEFKARHVYLVLSSPGETPAAGAGAAERQADLRTRRGRRRPRRHRDGPRAAPLLARLAARRPARPPVTALRPGRHGLRVHIRLGVPGTQSVQFA